MRLHLRTVVIVMVGISLMAGCTQLPAEGSPRAIDRDRVPDLAGTTVTSAGTSTVKGFVCFVSQANDTSDPELECPKVDVGELSTRALIDALAAGPDRALRKFGLATQVPQNTSLLDASLDSTSRVLTINLSSAINDVSSPNNTLAYRQIVETLTDTRNGLGATKVRVLTEGKESKIPTDVGQLPVASADDFGTAATTKSTTTAGRR